MSNHALNQIEETLAHQEQQISDLSDMVIRQGHEIDALQKQLVKILDKINAGSQNNEDNEKLLSASEHAALNKPPHY